MRFFDLATAIHEAGDNLESILYKSGSGQDDRSDEGLEEELNVEWVTELDTVATAYAPS